MNEDKTNVVFGSGNSLRDYDAVAHLEGSAKTVAVELVDDAFLKDTSLDTPGPTSNLYQYSATPVNVVEVQIETDLVPSKEMVSRLSTPIATTLFFSTPENLFGLMMSFKGKSIFVTREHVTSTDGNNTLVCNVIDQASIGEGDGYTDFNNKTIQLAPAFLNEVLFDVTSNSELQDTNAPKRRYYLFRPTGTLYSLERHMPNQYRLVAVPWSSVERNQRGFTEMRAA